MNRRDFLIAMGLTVSAMFLPKQKEPYNGRFKVYTQTPEDGVQLMGYKGINYMEAGVVYAPYVPLQMVPLSDFSSFSPRTGFKTRFKV